MRKVDVGEDIDMKIIDKYVYTTQIMFRTTELKKT